MSKVVRTKVASTRLTDAQHKKLIMKAKRKKMSVAVYVEYLILKAIA